MKKILMIKTIIIITIIIILWEKNELKINSLSKYCAVVSSDTDIEFFPKIVTYILIFGRMKIEGCKGKDSPEEHRMKLVEEKGY